MADLTPYSTAGPLLGKAPEWVIDPIDQQRIASYSLYEAMYWNVPNTFAITARGQNASPIYVPSGRQIVETFNRFLAPGLSVVVDPAYGETSQKELAAQVWNDFAARERFYSKFNTGKRYGLIRGDWAWHIWADPTREVGSRVSIYQIDPGSLFPIYDSNNLDNVIGWDIVEQIVDRAGKVLVSRQRYLKQTMTGGPSPIVYEKAVFEVDDWGGPNMDQDPKVIAMEVPPTVLPAPIDALPIYAIPNFTEPGALWGASEMRGVERLISAINQSISDEELALALEGIGVYVTDGGTPVDENDEEVPWNLGPGRVVEIKAGSKFTRVDGVGTFAPFQEHLSYIHDQIDATFGLSKTAKGNVDISSAVAGISMLLDLGPIVARAEEREVVIRDVHQQMLYGLGKWYSAYEGGAFNSLWEATRWTLVFGPRLPRNQAEEFEQTMTLAGATPALVPLSYVRDRLRKLGFDDMPEEQDLVVTMANEAAARNLSELDPAAERSDREAEEFLA